MRRDFVVALTLLLMSAPLWASGDCKGHSCDGGDVIIGDTRIGATTVNNEVTTGDMVGGDTTLNSKALALSNALGDVDIAGCLGSTQWATPLFSKQKLVVNWPCMATFYLNNNMPDLAAMAICNTEIRKEFATEQECRAAHDFAVMIEEAVIVVENNEDEWHEEQMQVQREYEERIAILESKLERPQVTRQIVEKGGLSEQQKQALREVKQ